MNTVEIGDIGEAIAIAEFTQAGFIVSKPLSNNARYDLIIDRNNKLYRVQVKTTLKIKDGKMPFPTKSTNYVQGKLKPERYTQDEIDLFFLYCVDNGWKGIFYLKDVFQVPLELKIRIEEPKNGQKIGVKFAKDYEFNKQIKRLYM